MLSPDNIFGLNTNTHQQGLIVGVVVTYAIFAVYAVKVLRLKFANGAESKYSPYGNVRLQIIDATP